jgi:hypothetical protein
MRYVKAVLYWAKEFTKLAEDMARQIDAQGMHGISADLKKRIKDAHAAIIAFEEANPMPRGVDKVHLSSEYRCTINKWYEKDTPGYEDLSARQGYYIRAASWADAIAQMAEKFPDEAEEGFTAQLWKKLT